jgi:CRISPR-associated protein Cmr5
MQQNVTTLKGIEQGRATYAFEAVKEISDDGSKRLKENYKSVAKKLPVLIKTNGLGQTLAFIKSKGGKKDKTGKKIENGYDKLYKQIGDWLRTDATNQLVPQGELVKQVIQLKSPIYRQVTVETLALLNWVRRFVDGLMKEVDEVEEVEEDN